MYVCIYIYLYIYINTDVMGNTMYNNNDDNKIDKIDNK